MPDKTPEEKLQGRIADATLLKDYAISRTLSITDALIEKTDLALASPDTADLGTLDIVIRDLTALTYPATAESIRASNGEDSQRFLRRLQWATIGAVLIALCWTIFSSRVEIKGGGAVEAVILGFLGASTFIFFNVLGLISEKAFRHDDIRANGIRLSLGPVLGWVFFVGLQDQLHNSTGAATFVLRLLPFLAGFSTRLVVGLFSQAIRAAEITLGLDNKGIELLARRRRAGPVERK